MAGYKETPRQKMISMMYLVLTAMLALNVSVEILNAFTTVNESVEQSNTALKLRIDETYGKFDQQYAINEAKVSDSWQKAQSLKKNSNDLIGFIDSLKFDVICFTEKCSLEEAKSTPLYKLKSKDNFDLPTNFFINNLHAKELRIQIENYKNAVRSILPEKVRDNFDLGLITDGEYFNANGDKEDWETHNFHHTVLAADIALLNKFIMDVQNIEYVIANYLYGSISEENFKFDKIDVKIIPTSNYVFVGDDYEADVLVVAYDTTQSPTAYIKEGASNLTENDIKSATSFSSTKSAGAVHITIPGRSEGIKKFAGLLQMPTPSGDINTYHFTDEFIVAKPYMTTSALKMNVFYAGVENPFSISVPGYGVAQIRPSISVGSIEAKGNEWIVKVPESAKDATITVNVNDNGKNVSMGSIKYRVKKVPNPTPTIANTNSGPISANAMVAAGAIIPQMPEDFDFDYRFTITSFEFIGVQRGGDLFDKSGKGNLLTDEMKTFIKNARNGDKIWIENITAKSPDGMSRKLSNISLQIQK